MRANIYIRKENEEFWSKLEDKSELINSWLVVLAEDEEDTVINCGVHGVPLNSSGKCMQKGCRYA
jgi:hypothetical protein